MYMWLVRIMSWYLHFNGRHFGLPSSSIHRMTGLGGKIVWTMTYLHRPHCYNRNQPFSSECVAKKTPNFNFNDYSYWPGQTNKMSKNTMIHTSPVCHGATHIVNLNFISRHELQSCIKVKRWIQLWLHLNPIDADVATGYTLNDTGIVACQTNGRKHEVRVPQIVVSEICVCLWIVFGISGGARETNTKKLLWSCTWGHCCIAWFNRIMRYWQKNTSAFQSFLLRWVMIIQGQCWRQKPVQLDDANERVINLVIIESQK